MDYLLCAVLGRPKQPPRWLLNIAV